MASDEDQNILAKEIKWWKGFEYALRKPNATLFNKMLKKVWRMKDMLLHSKQRDHSILFFSKIIWICFKCDKSISLLTG
jgi:hypothetical protein